MNPRRIIVCADDYGLTRPVNAAIRELLAAGRINATSVMVLAPAFDQLEPDALRQLQTANRSIQIGLHVTLTAPFQPQTSGFAPLREGAFLPLPDTLRAAIARRFRVDGLAAEIAAQLRSFALAFGGPPDFVDGHQHVHLFPQIRDAFLEQVAVAAPNAWVRQCGRAVPLTKRMHDPKGLLLDILSVAFRRKARRLGLRSNPAFAGTYDFDAGLDYAKLFPKFLEGLPDGGLVMCHPGVADAELTRTRSAHAPARP